MRPFLKYFLRYSGKFAILAGALLALAFAVQALNFGVEAARSAEFLSRVREGLLSCLGVIVPATFFFALYDTWKERRSAR